MIALEAKVRQAISAASDREAGYYAPAFPLVPGWVVRGALAGRWIRQYGQPSEGSSRRAEFLELFEGAVRFGPMLVDGSTIEPLSVAACKYPQGAECAAVFIDLAVAEADACPHCNGPLEGLKGSVRGVHVNSRARVSLDSTERARDGSLFTREEIPAGAILKGLVAGDHPWLAGLTNETLWFGGRRSTSGRADLSAAAGASATPGPSAPGTVVVRCVSPLIAVDRFARPVLQPDSRELAEALGVGESSLRLQRRFVRPVAVGGWHLASGLPKPREVAVAAGSTFVYEAQGVSDADLRRLAGSGLGLRQREGFGWIEVNPTPWSPPAEGAPAQVAQRGSLTSTALILLDERDRRWVVEALRERLERLETTSVPGSSEVQGTARYQMLSLAQQEEFATALQSSEMRAIRHLIDTLREVQ